MKKFLIILLFIFGFAMAESITLEKCFESAEQNHPLMKMINPLNKIGEIRLKNINANWLPDLNMILTATYQSDVTKLNIDLPPAVSSGFIIPEPDRDNYLSEIGISQLLFDGGLIGVQKELSNQDKKISKQQVKVNFQQIKASIVQVFYNLVILDKQGEVLTTWMKDLQKNRVMLSDLIETGAMEKSESYEIDIKIRELEQQIEENKILRKTNEDALLKLTGMERASEIEVYAPVDLQFDDNLENAQSILYEYQLRKMDIAKKVTFRNRLPKIIGFGKFGYGKPGLNMLSDEFDTYYMAGISLQWNIWDWKINGRERETLNFNQRILELNEETYNQKTKIQLDNYQSHIENLQQKVEKDEAIYKLYKNLKIVAETKYKKGVINTTDYLKYDNDFVRAALTREIRKIQLCREKVNYQLLKGEI